MLEMGLTPATVVIAALVLLWACLLYTSRTPTPGVRRAPTPPPPAAYSCASLRLAPLTRAPAFASCPLHLPSDPGSRPFWPKGRNIR